MRKRAIVILSLFLLSTSSFFMKGNTTSVKASNGLPVHNLTTGWNYTTIQEAVDAVETVDGHTIFVEEGIYHEHVVVNKSLSLIGEDKNGTIIDGGWVGTVVNITASKVNLTGFTIQWGSNDFYHPESGILLYESSSGCVIYDNIMKNNFFGIYAFQSHRHQIFNNTILENAFSGIYLVNSTGNVLFDNNCFNNSVGIFVNNSGNSTLSNNLMINNTLNFGLGVVDSHGLNNSIDTSNLAEGEPIYYLEDVNDVTFQLPLEVSTFCLINCYNVTIRDVALARNLYGIYCWNTTSSTFQNITAIDNIVDIGLYQSSYNNVWNSVVATSGFFTSLGLALDKALNNTFSGNTILGSIGYAVQIVASSGNKFFHNNIMNDYDKVGLFSDSPSDTNLWDNGFEGNYWSDYDGLDGDKNGIGESSYVINDYNADNCPLMGPFHSFNTSLGKCVNVISNSTIEGFEYELNGTIRFFVSNATATQSVGFCRVMIPKEVLAPPYTVVVDDGLTVVKYFYGLLTDNGTHRWIYFAYEHSQHKIDIIPEVPLHLILPLFMIATLLAAVVYQRKSIE